MKVEIEEVLKIIDEKQKILNNKITHLINEIYYYPINLNSQNDEGYNFNLCRFRELAAAFLALGEVYASISAMKPREEEQEGA